MTDHYDLCVIGGGSGGMASAKQAASLGAKVALFDFVKPSTQGTIWGLGGTCVNVGCVPKKLCHYSGILGHSFHDAHELGWQIDPSTINHDWNKLVETVTNHVRSLNFAYRTGLTKNKVNYINALVKFVDANTLSYTTKAGQEKTCTATHIIISVGGRPHIPENIPGAIQYAISSDDIFWLKKTAPGKTLCVGGGYISLECAGFLSSLGYDVTVAARSILLREFDRQCAEKIGSIMSDYGTKILTYIGVKSIEKLDSGKLLVKFEKTPGGPSAFPLSITEDTFDTVLYATGRQPDLKLLNLQAAGVVISPKTGKIPVINEVTNIAHIYAVGDVCEGKQELTPVAIHAGQLLAKRLFSSSTQLMDYDLVPTTIFTPSEYGTVGLSEEQAIKKYGEENLEVYIFEFTSLEMAAVHRAKKHPKNYSTSNNSNNENMENESDSVSANCLSKLICLKTEDEKVVGFHFIGPNAGEITQGFALSLRLGAKKSDFDTMVGIHPTDAESFCSLEVTRRSARSFLAEGGCGGGVCG